MRIEIEVELKDTPGQLVRALEPISRYGGNIISVVHMRENRRKGERVPVHITVELEEPQIIEKILGELENRDIIVSKLNEVKKKETLTIMLIGHVVDTDLRDTIDRINKIKGVVVVDVELSMPDPEKESSALMDIEVSKPEKAKKVINVLEAIAKEKNLLLIKSLKR